MDRLNSPSSSPRIDRVDVMLVCALVAVMTSYALGYRLDWSQLDAPMVSNTLPEGVQDDALPRVAPSASQPIMRPPVPAGPAWAANPGDESWEEMTQELARHAARHHGRVAIHLRDMRTGRSWAYHEDDLFPSASLVKVPVMVAVFSRIQEGRLSLRETLVLRRRHRSGGSGSLKWRPDGARLTVRDLLQFMISESDNTATALLMEAVGLGYIQDQLPKMGLVYTGIYQEGMSIKSGRVRHENYTTAREMNMLMEKIYKGELVSPEASRLMLDVLKHRKAVASRLAKTLPRGWEIAHKTGLLRQACHDSAVIFTPRGDFAITVLTGQNGSYKTAKDFISRLGRIAYVHYGGAPPRYYARASSKRHVVVR